MTVLQSNQASVKHFMTRLLFKTFLIIVLVFSGVTLPFYTWQLLDRESYENYLLKSVSPLTMDSRREILRQRGVRP